MSRRRRGLEPVPRELLKQPVPNFRSARELMNKQLPPVGWVVPGVLPEGVTLLAGKPKMGKSWLALGLCVAVASGGIALGSVRVEGGHVLYLALEDNERRLRGRLGKILAHSEAPEGLWYSTECPRLTEGGEEAIGGWLEAHAHARLVVVDTLKKIRPQERSTRNIYDVDYEGLEPLLPLAAKHRVAILVVHHLRTAPADDPLDEISGSTGLTGGVDGALVLRRTRTKADATMLVTGRDIEEERELALKWDARIAGWALGGDADEVRLTEERRAVLDFLAVAGAPQALKDLARGVSKSPAAVSNLLGKLAVDGRVERVGRGLWQLATPEGFSPLLRGVGEEDEARIRPKLAESGGVYTSPSLTPANAGNDEPTTGGEEGVSGEDPHGNGKNPSTASTPLLDDGSNDDWRKHSLGCACERCEYGD